MNESVLMNHVAEQTFFNSSVVCDAVTEWSTFPWMVTVLHFMVKLLLLFLKITEETLFFFFPHIGL